MSTLEVAANAATAICIWLAARNNVHTWAIGIVGCGLFGFLFFSSQLYADASLQIFFIVTSVIGWIQWRKGRDNVARPITRTQPVLMLWMVIAAAVVTLAYGWLLHRFTDAFMPFADAAVLAMSVVAQLLLMQRKLETWPWWLAVNTVAVPLFASRGLTLTAALYCAFWINAWYGWWRWHREAVQLSPASRSA